MKHPRILLTGCSGGGKSTLLDELARRGYRTVPEPGRRIVAAESDPDSPRLPWNDLECFARAAVALAIEDYEAMRDHPGPVFFDRGLFDAQVALAHAVGEAPDAELAARHPYDSTLVFLPPWPGIYLGDAERRHGFEAAQAEYDRLRAACAGLGYRARVLPRDTVAARADMLLATLG